MRSNIPDVVFPHHDEPDSRMAKGHFRTHRWIVLTLGVAVLVGSPTAAGTQSNFDGTWRVLIITEAGDCDRAYRYRVRMSAERSSTRARPGSMCRGAWIGMDASASGSGEAIGAQAGPDGSSATMAPAPGKASRLLPHAVGDGRRSHVDWPARIHSVCWIVHLRCGLGLAAVAKTSGIWFAGRPT